MSTTFFNFIQHGKAMKKDTSRITVTARIDKALWVLLKKAAKADSRSINSWFEVFLKKELVKKD